VKTKEKRLLEQEDKEKKTRIIKIREIIGRRKIV
jgi:hypothetical protein